MSYFAHINSLDELTEIDMSILAVDEYGSTDVKNIEVSEEVYFNQEKYVYKNGKIVLDPNYPAKHLAEVKNAKYLENDTKASEARYSQEFTITVQNKECLFDTTEQTQRDLLTAHAVCISGVTYDGWVTNNGVELDLTLEDVILISQTFKEKSSVYQQWKEYKTEIDEAQTVEQVEGIEINYVIE